MNSKTVHDIYLEAQAMQREGMSARKIAIHMGTLGAENGLAPIRTIGVGDQINQHFERTGETIWSDGYDWQLIRATLRAPLQDGALVAEFRGSGARARGHLVKGDVARTVSGSVTRRVSRR